MVINQYHDPINRTRASSTLRPRARSVGESSHHEDDWTLPLPLRAPRESSRSIYNQCRRFFRTRLRSLRTWRGGTGACLNLRSPTTLLLLFIAYTLFHCIILYPPYTRLPAHYRAIRERCEASEIPGRGNPAREKIFISSALYEQEGELSNGPWGKSILELIDLLGPENVYFSLYENNISKATAKALHDFGEKMKCPNSIVSENMNYDELPHMEMGDGTTVVKRVAFLAEIRNRALRPLDPSSNSTAATTTFSKILFLNDVFFDPISIVQLLFATNASPDPAQAALPQSNYRAACAMDYYGPFKYYDTLATRDFEGRELGLPFYPWFAKGSTSLDDVYAQRDAVRVRSCWGGITAFDARYFQVNSTAELGSKARPPAAKTLPIRFRYDEEMYLDASECCLIHADVQPVRSSSEDRSDTGVYMNPYIRTAYYQFIFNSLRWSRRLEKLNVPLSRLVNAVWGLPGYNPRRTAEVGAQVVDKVWDPTSQTFREQQRTAGVGRFCSERLFMVKKEYDAIGESSWYFYLVPSGYT